MNQAFELSLYIEYDLEYHSLIKEGASKVLQIVLYILTELKWLLVPCLQQGLIILMNPLISIDTVFLNVFIT